MGTSIAHCSSSRTSGSAQATLSTGPQDFAAVAGIVIGAQTVAAVEAVEW